MGEYELLHRFSFADNANLDLILRKIKIFKYNYDLGDDWEAAIEVLSVSGEGEEYPRLISFTGGMAKEDCGGAEYLIQKRLSEKYRKCFIFLYTMRIISKKRYYMLRRATLPARVKDISTINSKAAKYCYLSANLKQILPEPRPSLSLERRIIFLTKEANP